MQDLDDTNALDLSRKPLMAEIREEYDILDNPFVVNKDNDDTANDLDESTKPMLKGNNNFLFSDPEDDDD